MVNDLSLGFSFSMTDGLPISNVTLYAALIDAANLATNSILAFNYSCV
jgi:hypothetical protein